MQRRWLLLVLVVAAGCQKPARPARRMADEYRFDNRGRLVQIIRPGGHSLHYAYDSDDRLVKFTFGGSVEYGYEPGGNRLWMKDAKGTAEYYRDAMGRVSDVILRYGAPRWSHFEHDAWGNVTVVSIWALDAAVWKGPADPVRAVLEQPLSKRPSDWAERYRAAAAVAARLASLKPEYQVRYQYDNQRRIVALETAAGRSVYRWSSEGRQVERTLPNGLKSAWSFNDDGRLTRLTHAGTAGQPLAEYRYFYADSDRLWRVEESDRGSVSTIEYRRDARGRTCEAMPGADASQLCQTDVMGRPEAGGGAVLHWDANGLLSARTAGQQTINFEYDDRGLPIRALGPGLDLAFEWDGDGRVQAGTDRGTRRTYLVDPTYATAEPWMEFDATGALTASRFCDAAAFAETDGEGQVRYLLRDGFNSLRYVFDARGGLLASTPSPAAGRQEIVKDRWTTAPIETGASYAIFDSTPDGMRRFLALSNSRLQERLNGPDAVGRVYRARIDALLNGFFKSTRQTGTRLILEPARADWSAAARDTKSAFPKGDGIYLPSEAEPLAPLVFPSLAGSASMAARNSGRVLDLPAIIEKAAAAGKPLRSITCAKGCSGELERNIPTLRRFARRGRPLPVILAQTAYLGQDAVRRLQESGYRVLEWGAPVLQARLRPPAHDRRYGVATVPCVGAVPVFPGAAGSAPAIPATGTGSADRLAPLLPEDAASLIVGDAGPLPPRVQLEDPFPAMQAEADQFEAMDPADPVAKAGMLSGATYELARHRLVLIGDGKVTAAAVTTADLAAALFLAYQPEPQFPRFSLDPADRTNPAGPWLKPRYLPDGLLANSPFGRTMFQADWLMKQYSFGVIVDAQGNIREREFLPGGLEDLFQISFRSNQLGERENWTRMWILPGEVKIQKTAQTIFFESTPLVVRAKRQVVDPTSPDGLRDEEGPVDPPAQQFANTFSANYELVAGVSPVFARLREMTKLVEMAHWLRQIGAPLDLDWARQQAAGRHGPERVPALTSERSLSLVEGISRENDIITHRIATKQVRLFGGVSLRVKPAVTGESGRLRSIEDAGTGQHAAEDLRTSSMPLEPRGGAPRVSVSQPATIEFGEGQGVRRFDASGQMRYAEFPDGVRAEYSLGPQGRILGTRIALPDASSLERAGGDASQWTVTGADGRQLVYRYDQLGRLSEIRAGGQTAATYHYKGNIIQIAAGDYTEEVTLDAAGRAVSIERSGPRIDGLRFTDRTEPPAVQRGTATVDPASLPTGPTVTSEGNRVEVSASRRGGFFSAPQTVIEMRTIAPEAQVLLPVGAGRLDAQGRLADTALARQLDSDPPARLIVMDSPATARALENHYGDRMQVLFGTDANLANINAGKIPVVEGPGDIAVYLAPAEAGVKDFEVLSSIRELLPDMPFHTDTTPSPDAKVVAIAGHDSPELESFVERMGQAGALSGKLLMLDSCERAIQPEWNARMIQKYGVLGIRSFTGEIDVQALKDVMIRYYELLGRPELEGTPIDQVWRQAVELAAQEAEQEGLRHAIEQLLEVVTQISQLASPRGTGEGAG